MLKGPSPCVSLPNPSAPANRIATIPSSSRDRPMGQEDQGPNVLFRTVSGPDKALDRFLAEKDQIILHGRRIEKPTGATVAELCIRFMTTKDAMLASGELSVHSRRDYFRVCETLVNVFAKGRLLTEIHPDDFERLRASWPQSGDPSDSAMRSTA
jgi:hypothetical protein